jgi:tRNA1(Val) A37 N6-methylase TrmN6
LLSLFDSDLDSDFSSLLDSDLVSDFSSLLDSVLVSVLDSDFCCGAGALPLELLHLAQVEVVYLLLAAE